MALFIREDSTRLLHHEAEGQLHSRSVCFDKLLCSADKLSASFSEISKLPFGLSLMGEQTSPDSQASTFSRDSLPTLRQLQLHHLVALFCSLLVLAAVALLPIYGWSSPTARPALYPEYTIGFISYLSTISLQSPFFVVLNWLFSFHFFRPSFRTYAPLALHALLQEGVRLLVVSAVATPVRSISGPHVHPHESVSQLTSGWFIS